MVKSNFVGVQRGFITARHPRNLVQ